MRLFTRISLLFMIMVLVSSCSKDLEEEYERFNRFPWMLGGVKDLSDNSIQMKLPLDSEHIIVAFDGSGASFKMMGYTPFNTFSSANIRLYSGQRMQILSLAQTEVVDTQWGDIFLYNIGEVKEYKFVSPTSLQLITGKVALMLFPYKH